MRTSIIASGFILLASGVLAANGMATQSFHPQTTRETKPLMSATAKGNGKDAGQPIKLDEEKFAPAIRRLPER